VSLQLSLQYAGKIFSFNNKNNNNKTGYCFAAIIIISSSVR